MEWVLIIQLCSSISGVCSDSMSVKNFNVWSNCVRTGANEIIKYVDNFEPLLNRDRLIVRYWCYEDKINKTPASSKYIK